MASCKEGVVNLTLLYLRVMGAQSEEIIIKQMAEFLNGLHRVEPPTKEEEMAGYKKWREDNLRIKERYLGMLLREMEEVYISRRPHAISKECLELNEQGKGRVEQLPHSENFLTYYAQRAPARAHNFSFKKFDAQVFRDALANTVLLYIKDFLKKTMQEPWRQNKLILHLEGLLPVEHIFHIIHTLEGMNVIGLCEDGNFITKKVAVP